jgi:hypothetical protein
MNFIPSLDKEKRTIDHINIIPMDNWKTNLRPVSKTVQSMNRKIFKNNTSGRTGVAFDKENNRWRVYYSLNGTPKKEDFYVGSAINGYSIAKQNALLFREKIEKELPEYREALGFYRPGHVDIPIDTKNYNLEDIERSNNRALRLRGIKQSNRICLNGVRFQEDKNCFYVEWNQKGKHYSKKFKVKKNEVAYGGSTHLRSIFYLSTMESINK